MSTTQSFPSPFVYWGQTSDTITLLVDLKSCHNHQLNLQEQSLSFRASGIGGHGRQMYGFDMKFYKEIVAEESFIKVSDREVEIVLKKRMLILWPRLLVQGLKPGWLKVDFGRIKQADYESSDEDQDDQKSLLTTRSVKDRHFGRGRRKAQDFKTTYLFLYNLFQFCGFLCLLVILLIHLLKEGAEESMKSIYSSTMYLVMFLQFFQLLEIIHPAIGLTKGSPLMPTFQICGRLFILLVFVHRQPEMHRDVSTFYLFLTYALAEVFRYPYYMLHVFRVNIRMITWIRYTAWVGLYPMGFFAEGAILYKSIPLTEKSGLLTISMPNNWNIAFYTPGVLRFYVYFGIYLFFFYMTSHMYRQRQKVLNYSKIKLH